MFAVLAFAAMAAPVTALGATTWSGLPVLMGAFGSRFVSAFYVLWVISILMAEDGHKARISIFTAKGLALCLPYAIGAGVFGAIMYGQVVSLMLQGVGMPLQAPTSIRDFMSLVSYAGGTMSGSTADVIVFSGLGLYVWPVLLISLGATWRNCIGLAPMLLSRVPLVMVTFFFLSLALSTAAMSLPLWTGFPLEVVWVGWMYVATRELFAGIVKNREREKVSLGKLAPSAT